MSSDLISINKFFIFFGLAGFVGCFLSVIISVFFEEISTVRIESVSTFFLGSSFAQVVLEKVLPDFILLNIFLALSCGAIASFLSSHFFYVSLKKTFDHEIEV